MMHNIALVTRKAALHYMKCSTQKALAHTHLKSQWDLIPTITPPVMPHGHIRKYDFQIGPNCALLTYQSRGSLELCNPGACKSRAVADNQLIVGSSQEPQQ